MPLLNAAVQWARLATPMSLPPLQLLHWTWHNNQRLWLLATPTCSGAALDVGALVEAVHAARHAPHTQGGSDGWTSRHYEAAALGLAVVSAAALLLSTCFLLAAAATPALRPATGQRQPLQGQEEGRKRRGRHGAGSQRMRLVQGTFRYLVPDQLHLKVRWVASACVVNTSVQVPPLQGS